MAKEKKEKTAAKAQNDKNEAQEKLEALEKEVAELKEKLAKEKDDYMRLMAEFETFRRRTAEEKLALVGSAATDTIKGMLPVLDDLERAMEMLCSRALPMKPPRKAPPSSTTSCLLTSKARGWKSSMQKGSLSIPICTKPCPSSPSRTRRPRARCSTWSRPVTNWAARSSATPK